MAHFLAVALSFPGIVYSVLLGVALVYWVFVMIGAAHIDLLGEGAADGAADGLDVGGHEVGGHDAGGHDADVDVDVDVDVDGEGLGGILGALKLRSAPATVVLSLVFLFAWLITVVGLEIADVVLPPVGVTVAKFVMFVLAPVLALLPTSLAVRPLAKLFVATEAASNQDLIGKVCTIRTGTVTERFGEAMLEDGGAGVVVRVRVDAGEKLERGDQAVIVGYDEDQQEFTVAKMDDGLEGAREPGAERARH